MILGPDELRRLAASDRETWQRLIAHAATSEACPPETVEVLLAIDDFDGWMRHVFRAYGALPPDDGRDADEVFRRWLSTGIARAFPPTNRRALENRHRVALNDTSADASEHTRALVAAIEKAPDARDLLGRAWLLLARRLSEDLDPEGAIAASLSAEEVFASIGDDAWRAQAVRMRGAALLRAHKIDEALAVLDSVADAPSTSFWASGRNRYDGVVLGSDGHYHPERELDPVDAVLHRAVAIAVMAPATHPEWLRTLDAIARATGHRECARRAEASRYELLDDDAVLPRQMR